MAPRLENKDDDEDRNPAAGRALYSGTVSGGRWQMTDASPAVPRDTLDDAMAFVRDVAKAGRLPVRSGPEREAFDAAAAVFSPEEDSLRWEGGVVQLSEPEERTLLLLAGPVFRARFGAQWPVDADDEW